MNIPDPSIYKKRVFNYFKENNILDNLLILDLFQQHENKTNLWIDLAKFLNLDMDILQQHPDIDIESYQPFPHINVNGMS